MKKLILLGLLIGFPAVLIIGFIFLNSEPDRLTSEEREEAIDTILGRRANLNPDIKTGSTTFRGKHIEFAYPAKAVIYEYQDPNSIDSNPDAERFSFDLKNPRLVFNYNVSKTSETKLEDVPSVKFRQDKSNGYSSKAENVDGAAGISFTKDRSGEYMAEKSLFMIKDGNLITISITGSSLSEIEKLYSQIIASVIFTD